MLSHLDCIIFPDRCEVIEVVPSQRYVYPIFKNGKSSLYNFVKAHNSKVFINEQIKKLNSIDIVLRDPQQRLLSGINSYVQMTMRDHPYLHEDTVIWYAKNHLFLNRHYAPQFLWLINLARYIDPQAKLNFFDIKELDGMIAIHQKPVGILPLSDKLAQQLTDIPDNLMYDRIEQILMTCCGMSMDFNQLLSLIKQKDHTAYDWVVGRSQRILSPTYALS